MSQAKKSMIDMGAMGGALSSGGPQSGSYIGLDLGCGLFTSSRAGKLASRSSSSEFAGISPPSSEESGSEVVPSTVWSVPVFFRYSRWALISMFLMVSSR